MVNPEELLICKRRGHDITLLDARWKKCKWCVTWVRELRTVEEREDDPPKDDQSIFENIPS